MAHELGDRYTEALAFAVEAHAGHLRKGTDITYLSHLLAVSANALEDGATETVAIAALLHDSIEDTDVTADQLQERFGAEVASIVAACSDTDVMPKPPWKQRKQDYLDHLRALDPVDDAGILTVSLADKLHNARSILADFRGLGDELWGRFSAGREQQLWYYGSLVEIFQEKRPGRNAASLAAAVGDIARLAAERQI